MTKIIQVFRLKFNPKYFWWLVLSAFVFGLVSTFLVILATVNTWGSEKFERNFYPIALFTILKSITVIIVFKLSRKFDDFGLQRAVGIVFITLDIAYYLLLFIASIDFRFWA